LVRLGITKISSLIDGRRARLKFIDLFAGLGGFHQALVSLGHECVFASEIDPELAELYFKNFGLTRLIHAGPESGLADIA